MRFDDRLSTVLGLSAEAPRDRAVQWRQLVELVARGAGASDPQLRDRALGRIAELSPNIPDAVRASAAKAIAAPAVPAQLVALFAADRAEVAAPLLGAAKLTDAEWEEVRAAASAEVRELVDQLRPPAAPQAAPRNAETVPPPPSLTTTEEIAGMFRWECGPSGDIEWVEGVPRAALIGRSLRQQLPRNFERRQAFDDMLLAEPAEGPLAGEWHWSGRPEFLPGNGLFAGFSGIARRPGAPTATALPELIPEQLDHDALRELIHELRTPLTAIIGFGEIIEGQFLGPAHRAYRDRAGEIVRQARRLLAAVEDLDLAARLRSGRSRKGRGAPAAPLVAAVARELAPLLGERRVALRTTIRVGDSEVDLSSDLAERLLRRFSEALIDTAGEGESFELVVDRIGDQLAFALDRPATARGLSEQQLVGGEGAPLGVGFALRLVRGLATIAGGSLDIGADRVILLLPAA